MLGNSYCSAHTNIISRLSNNCFQLSWTTVTLLFVLFPQMNLGYYHREFFQIETTEVKLYPGHKNVGEFVLCLKYLLDGTQEERVLQRMGLHWLMQCAIADKKLMRILSSVVIRVVLFSNFTCLVWVSTLFPKPGIAPDVKLYQKSKKRGSKQHSANTKPKLTRLNTHQANNHTNLNKH